MTDRTTIRPADEIKRWLLAGKEIDAVQAGIEFGYWRLASLVERLRRRGWPISSERQNGNGLAVYSLPRGWRPASSEHSNMGKET